MKRTIARSAWKLLALGMLIALLAAGNAFAGHETGSVPSYTGCLNPNGGTVYYLALGEQPQKQCNSGHPHIHLSGGDITAVAAGPGLTGGGSDGAISLAVDSQQVQTRVSGDCTSPGEAIAQIEQGGTVICNSGPAVILGAIDDTNNVADSFSDPEYTIGTLPLPPGTYLILAKVKIDLKTTSALEDIWRTKCALVYNEAVLLDRGSVGGDTEWVAGGTITMIGTVNFTEPGTVSVQCSDGGDELEVGDEEWSFLKISAVKLGNLVVNP
jgi:hypothetical protein